MLLYADDIVLLAESPEQLQAMMQATAEYAKKWQFRFNAAKSGVVICADSNVRARQKDRQWMLGSQRVQVRKEYRYLGLEMGRAGKRCWKSAIDGLANKAEKRSAVLT